MMIVNRVARRLKQIFEPIQYQNFEVLRHDVYLNHIERGIQNVEWFRHRLKSEIDHHYRKELICGDCYLESTQAFESALGFFLGQTNIALGNKHFLRSILEGILSNYFPDQNTSNELSKELIKLIEKFRGGTLYSICIPKEQFEKVSYFSLPYGHPFAKR